MRGRTKCLKKRKRIYFCFLMHVFLFLKLFSENFDKEDTRYYDIKIHGTFTITANAPLLNLNLNYEKLRHKDNKFYLLTTIYHSNFCIF